MKHEMGIVELDKIYEKNLECVFKHNDYSKELNSSDVIPSSLIIGM